MKSINATFIVSLLSLTYGICASQNDTFFDNLFTDSNCNEPLIQRRKIFDKAKITFTLTKTAIKILQEKNQNIPTKLQNKYDAASITWFGKPWNILTEEEKSKHYKDYTDPYCKKTWKTLRSYEKEKFNTENPYLYDGQCGKQYQLERDEEEFQKNLKSS